MCSKHLGEYKKILVEHFYNFPVSLPGPCFAYKAQEHQLWRNIITLHCISPSKPFQLILSQKWVSFVVASNIHKNKKCFKIVYILRFGRNTPLWPLLYSICSQGNVYIFAPITITKGQERDVLHWVFAVAQFVVGIHSGTAVKR